MDIPVLLLVFNRPHLLKTQIDALRMVEPSKVFVSADGARQNRKDDEELCLKVRKVIESEINWDCEIKTRYLEKNYGCGVAPSSGISWFFDHVEEGIILEDDCIPHITFFQYVSELLNRYRDDEQIMSINGGHFPIEKVSSLPKSSYFFSHYPHLWGWATWKRAWKHFSFELPTLSNDMECNAFFGDIVENSRAISDWKKKFSSVANGDRRDIWDYQWVYACWKKRGLSILPTVNMVENIGFGEDSTHTFNKENYDVLPVEPMSFPLNHPKDKTVNRVVEDSIEREVFLRKGIWNVAKYQIEKFLPKQIIKALKGR